jgi:hypothetical protein
MVLCVYEGKRLAPTKILTVSRGGGGCGSYTENIDIFYIKNIRVKKEKNMTATGDKF